MNGSPSYSQYFDYKLFLSNLENGFTMLAYSLAKNQNLKCRMEGGRRVGALG